MRHTMNNFPKLANQPPSDQARRPPREEQIDEQNRAQHQQEQRQQQNHPRQNQQPQQRSANFQTALSALTTISTGRKIMQHVRPERQSSAWLASELLKRTDLDSGDICMFHYPMDFFPSMDVDEMAKALGMILRGGRRPAEGQLQQAREERWADREEDNALARRNEDYVIPQAYASNATLDARNRITRIQFSWYQFEEFPREVLGRAYGNLQHLDIRQNASLTCIDSLISQLPHLSSLNLSDCPNIRTLAPLATALALPGARRMVRDEDGDFDLENFVDERLNDQPARRTLNLRHLWIRGCNLSTMPDEEWAIVFDALSKSSGPLERLTLSRNGMKSLHPNVGKLKGLTYLFVEDNYANAGNTKNNDASKKGFVIPDELGDLPGLRFVSFCGNNVTSLPQTMGRLDDNCDVYLHRNPGLSYPPPEHQKSIKAMRRYFHEERMKLLRGAVLFMPHCRRARMRANERLYRPGGYGYMVCKERFEEQVRRISITLMD